MISSENMCMLELLSHSLHDQATNRIESDVWHKVYQELLVQAVHTLPAPQIGGVGLNDADRADYMSAIGKNLQTFYNLMEDQQKLLNIFENAGIPVVVLKGAAAAMNYPHPEYRCMGDIDIIVQPDNFNNAYELLCHFGCTAHQTVEDYHRHIGFHSKQGVEIELHNYFSSSMNNKQNQILDEYVYHGIADYQTAEVCGYQVPVLPTLENGLVLLAHINQHLGSGLGLRQIIDWMFYVEQYLDDGFWEDKFSRAAEQIGMRQLAMVTTAMCQKYLGLKKNYSWFTHYTDAPICDELMEYILSHGNFGRKDSTGSTTVTVIRILRNPIRGIKEAQEIGCRTWTLLKGHSWLRPFAWIYQIYRWLKRGIQRGVTISSVASSAQTEQIETDFLRRLGVTRL